MSVNELASVKADEKQVLFTQSAEVRWADCDANSHMRHSAYADLCAHARVTFMTNLGLSQDWFNKHQIGPVLFKEETIYLSEVHIGEKLFVTVEPGVATGFTKSIQMYQRILKENGDVSAELRCVVGFMDLQKRKIIELPEEIKGLFLVEEKV